MDLTFRWDPRKAAANLIKHGISFEEGITAFYDPLSITIPDTDHSTEEDRNVLVGMSTKKRILIVAHADRGDNIRIISARLATRAEKRKYEKEAN